MENVETVNPGEILTARCTYNSSGHDTPTRIGLCPAPAVCRARLTRLLLSAGHTGGDEMCNLYLMFYTVSPQDDFVVCVDEQNPGLTSQLPPGSDVPLPPNPLLEHSATGETPLSYDNGQGEAGLSPPVKRPESSVRKRPGVALNGDYDSYNPPSPSLTDTVAAPDTNTDEAEGGLEVQPRSAQYQPRCVEITFPPVSRVNRRKGFNLISVIRYGYQYQYQVPEYQYQDTNFPQLDIDDQSSLDARARLEKKQDRVRLGGHLITVSCYSIIVFYLLFNDH